MPNPPPPKPKKKVPPPVVQHVGILPAPYATTQYGNQNVPVPSPFHTATTDPWKYATTNLWNPSPFHKDTTDPAPWLHPTPAVASGPSAANLKLWNDTVKWNAAVAAGQALDKSTGGGSSGASHFSASLPTAPAEPLFTPEVADLSKNPYPGYYDKLLAFVQAQGASRPGEFAAVGDQFKARQAEANKQMYDMYQGSRAGTDASANALGVDPAVVSAARDLAMRKNQENSDQSLADNQAWLSKMGLLSKNQADTFATQFAGQEATGAAGWDAAEQQRVGNINLTNLQALIAQQAAAAKLAAGSGGGKRKGGGGGSSSAGGVTDTATETTTDAGTYDPAVVAALQGNPAALAQYMNTVNLTSPNKVVSTTQGNTNTDTQIRDSNLNSFMKAIVNPFSSSISPAQITANQVAAQEAAKRVAISKTILAQTAGAPQVSKKVVTTSKNKTKANPKVL